MGTVPCFNQNLHSFDEDKAFWRQRIFPHCDVTGAYEGSTLVGQVAHAQGWIHHFHVDPAWHGRGIGSSLLREVQRKLADIQLWTFQANAGARRVYERHGFVAVEYTDGSGNEEKEPDVRYRWLR
jgi:GNAT superfamily N-acetyltransferase